ncbi:unnamed protein product [Toxocara canis]|uniref:ELL domain-containing protein n=1 Tax=Toxocara canis TaxID=6265 RepID=A0A183U3U4_TOXCA|nr:unnamed protein product [Toxocara canis]
MCGASGASSVCDNSQVTKTDTKEERMNASANFVDDVPGDKDWKTAGTLVFSCRDDATLPSSPKLNAPAGVGGTTAYSASGPISFATVAAAGASRRKGSGLRQKPVHEAMGLGEQGIPPDGKVASLTIRLPSRYALVSTNPEHRCDNPEHSIVIYAFPCTLQRIVKRGSLHRGNYKPGEMYGYLKEITQSICSKKMISTGSQGTILSKDADREQKDKCASSSPTSMSSMTSNSSNTPKASTAAPAATTVQRPALSTMGNTLSTNWTIQLKKDLGIGAKPITHLGSREQRSQPVEPQPTPQSAPHSKKALAARPLTSVMQQQPISQIVEFVSGEDSNGPSALPEYQFGFHFESNASAGDERGGDVCTATSKSRSISRSAKIEVCFRKDKGSLTYFPFLNS